MGSASPRYLAVCRQYQTITSVGDKSHAVEKSWNQDVFLSAGVGSVGFPVSPTMWWRDNVRCCSAEEPRPRAYARRVYATRETSHLAPWSFAEVSCLSGNSTASTIPPFTMQIRSAPDFLIAAKAGN